MSLDDLKKQFIVDENSLAKALEAQVARALEYCIVGDSGRVHIKDHKLPGKAKVKLALAARGLASQLDGRFARAMTVDEVADAAGLPANQARARLSEAADERFAEPVGRGSYQASLHRIAAFLEELASEGETG